MKKINPIIALQFFVIAILVALAFTTSRNTAASNVVLGRQGDDCRGRGICSFESAAESSLANISSITLADSSLSICFLVNGFSAADKMKFFGTETPSAANTYYFSNESRYVFSNADKAMIGLDDRFTGIPAQEVPIRMKENTATISLRLN